MDTTIGLVEGHGLDVVLAEAVGSCADLTATVVRPLREYHGLRFDVAPLTVLLEPQRWRDLAHSDDTVAYLFRKQLEEAPVVALHKVDLLDDAERGELLRAVRQALHAARVVATSTATVEGLDELLRIWSAPSTAVGDAPAYEIDYATYAAAEARLAWLNITFEVHHPRGFAPADWVTRVLTGLSAVCAARGAVVGHAKAQVVGHAKAQASWGAEWAKASLVRAGDAPVTAVSSRASARMAEIIVNARVDMDPEALRRVVDEVVARAGALLGTEADTVHVQCFRPAPPQPTHRLPEPSGMS